MKRGNSPISSWEKMQFGAENALTIFPPNTFNFNPKRHVIVNNRQQCLLDNFWYQANNAKENKGYFCSVLNSLAEYFNKINKILPKSTEIEVRPVKPIYVLFDGKKPGIYVTFDEILIEKVKAKQMKEDITWRKYLDINEALTRARSAIGENYYIEPAAKEYIESNTIASVIQKGEASGLKKPKEEESPKYGSYKQCLIKGVDPLDGEYIDQKIDEKMEEAMNSIKLEIKEQVLREVRVDITEKFHELKKQHEEELRNLKEEYDEFKNNLLKYDMDMEDSQLPE
jgi:hypothetical protein